MPKRSHAKPQKELEYIKLALAEAAKCKCEDERAHPKVGAVAVKDGKVLATAHRGELEPGQHAEFTALEKKLEANSLAGATIYTTLEPCTTRNHPKVPCAQRLVERKVRRVVIGMLDPNERICGRGLWHLRESGIETDLFSHQYMAEAEELNREFIRNHRPKLRWGTDDDASGAIVRAIAPPTSEIQEPEDPIYTLVSDLFDAAEKSDFGAAEVALRELQSRSTEKERKERLQILFWHLKVKHAHDAAARGELQRAIGPAGNGPYAADLLASTEQAAGNIQSATSLLNVVVATATDPDVRATFAIKAASLYKSANEDGLAIKKLMDVTALELAPIVRAQVLHSLANTIGGDAAGVQKAALLVRAASLDPTNERQFAAAYALGELRLHALSAVHYEHALTASPDDSASLNNLAVAFDALDHSGLAVPSYRRAADKGSTLAMANLAQQYLKAGFYSEAEAEIKRGRLSEDPDERVGAAMISLAKAKQDESQEWGDERKIALGQRRFFDELADALTAETRTDLLAGTWSIASSVNTTLQVVGAAAEAAWEDSKSKRRLRGRVTGAALVGTLEEWSAIWDKFENKGTICLILRDGGTLAGVVVSGDGAIRTIEWVRTLSTELAKPASD